MSTETFADFDLKPEIIEALSDAGIIHPFPIQAMTMPVALRGHDVIGQAKTGTGKTLGFGLPALERLNLDPNVPRRPGAPQVLIVVPTRELAVQVAGDLRTAASELPVEIATIYGGKAYEPQIAALEKGVDIVVGTPGRLIDLQRQRRLILDSVHMLVLDEADEMLDLGFLPDVERLLSATPSTRQTMLFSATMPGPVIAMARQYMRQPTHIRASDPDDDSITKKDIRQLIYRAHQLDKDEVVSRILQAENRGRTIIFTQTKRSAAKLAEELTQRGFAAGAIHGDLGQVAREQALRAFRTGEIDVLVATDVAARGIDVDDITHVINFQSPDDEKTYLHRVGRTGRAGKKGTAVTFVDWEDLPRWSLINKALGLPSPEPQETYSSSDHLYTDLGIPRTAKGRLTPAKSEAKTTRKPKAATPSKSAARSTETSGRGANSRRRRTKKIAETGASAAATNSTEAPTSNAETASRARKRTRVSAPAGAPERG